MKRYIPNQHGAWAMLVIPFLFGMFAAGPAWIHALLFLCWLLIYLFTFPVLQGIRRGKWERYKGPIRFYGSILAPAALLLLWLMPDLALYGFMLLPLFLINVIYAWKGQERALLNDVTAILLFSSVVFPAYAAGGGENWLMAGELAALTFVYLVGTVFYVKTMIREKENPVYYGISVGYHILLAAGAFLLQLILLLPAGVLLLRAVIGPRSGMTVKQSGIMEIAHSVLVTIVVLVVYL